MGESTTEAREVQAEIVWGETAFRAGVIEINGKLYRHRTRSGADAAPEFGIAAYVELERAPRDVPPGDPAFYTVSLLDNGALDCDCADSIYRPERGPCKHAVALRRAGILDDGVRHAAPEEVEDDALNGRR